MNVMHRRSLGMSEDDMVTQEALRVADVYSFFQLVLGSLTDHFDISIYQEDFPFA